MPGRAARAAVAYAGLAYACVVYACMAAAPALGADSAVILMYHRFGEDGQPSTNIRIAEFEAHLRELSSGSYNVRSLVEVLNAIRDGKPLPDRTIAITIDDGYASVHSEAWPRLKAAKLPFTIFIATTPIDGKTKGMMSWDQIRELAQDGVGIGAHTLTHLHMVEADDQRNRDELVRAGARIAEELGKPADIFAYPYGEASQHVMTLVKEAGYRFALGQHSGVAHPTMNDLYIPRFAVNESYGDLARLRLVLNALPVPVADVTPYFGFTVTDEDARIRAMSCYSSSEGRMKVEPLGEHRVEVRFARPLPAGRASRVNCTMPGPDGRWRWHGTAFYVPKN